MEEEINIYQLWLKVKARWKLVVTVVLFSLLGSFIYLGLAKSVYETTFMLKVPRVLTTAEAVAYVNSLDLLIKQKRYDDLQSTLMLDSETVDKIKQIKASSVRKAKQTIKITLEVYDPGIIKDVSRKIVDYLNSNELVKQEIEVRKYELMQKIKNLEKRIDALEKTKKIINNIVLRGGRVYFNPAEIDGMIEEMKSNLLRYKTQLKLLKGFEISVLPNIPEEPKEPRKKVVLLASFITSLFFGIFLALFLDWLEVQRTRYSTQ